MSLSYAYCVAAVIFVLVTLGDAPGGWSVPPVSAEHTRVTHQENRQTQKFPKNMGRLVGTIVNEGTTTGFLFEAADGTVRAVPMSVRIPYKTPYIPKGGTFEHADEMTIPIMVWERR